MAEVVANMSMSLDGKPFLVGLSSAPAILETPAVVEGHGVIHLHYRVRREG